MKEPCELTLVRRAVVSPCMPTQCAIVLLRSQFSQLGRVGSRWPKGEGGGGNILSFRLESTIAALGTYLGCICGTFFWDYSVYSNSGIDGTCVLLGAIPIPELTECYYVHSAPDSRMDGIVFWRENFASAPVSFDHVSYSVFGIARGLFYWELIFCVLFYSYSEIGINGIVPKERALGVVRC